LDSLDRRLAYPLTETLKWGEPHELWIINNTGVSQAFDVTMHFMVFRTKELWDKYRAMVEEMSTLIKIARGILVTIARAVERIIGALRVVRVVRP